MQTSLYAELPQDLFAFLMMPLAALIVGLGLRRHRGSTESSDIFYKVGGTVLVLGSVPACVMIVSVGLASAGVRVDFKNRLQELTGLPYSAEVDGREVTNTDAKTVVSALKRTYGAAPSHSGPTDTAVVILRSSRGILSLTIRNDSLPRDSLWLYERKEGRRDRPIGRVSSSALKSLLFGGPGSYVPP